MPEHGRVPVARQATEPRETNDRQKRRGEPAPGGFRRKDGGSRLFKRKARQSRSCYPGRRDRVDRSPRSHRTPSPAVVPEIVNKGRPFLHPRGTRVTHVDSLAHENPGQTDTKIAQPGVQETHTRARHRRTVWKTATFTNHTLKQGVSVMILPQVHLRKPCYDFYFL